MPVTLRIEAIKTLREALQSEHLTMYAESRIRRAIMLLENKSR